MWTQIALKWQNSQRHLWSTFSVSFCLRYRYSVSVLLKVEQTLNRQYLLLIYYINHWVAWLLFLQIGRIRIHSVVIINYSNTWRKWEHVGPVLPLQLVVPSSQIALYPPVFYVLARCDHPIMELKFDKFTSFFFFFKSAIYYTGHVGRPW